MILEGVKLEGVESCMKSSAGHMATIYLEIGPDAEAAKSSLQNKYQAKILNQFQFPGRLLVEIPKENLKKALEEDYVTNCDWPSLLEEVERTRNRIGASL